MCSCIASVISLICFIIIGLTIFLVLRFAVRKAGLDDDIGNIKNNIQDKLNELFKQNDPYTGNNDTQVWKHNNKGLTLTLLNALTDDWYPFYNEAIANWDDGTPDVLTLSTEIITPEKDCTSVDDVMKVCNGDYGEVGWKGINKIMMDTITGRIVTSSALMNEFYLTSTTSDDDKLYTMCHEIGHGFGLPHTDENFYNTDLLNCLDYTMNPTKNKLPGDVNFNRLATMYGSVDGSIKPDTSTNRGTGNNNNNGNTNTNTTTSIGDDDGVTEEESIVTGNRTLVVVQEDDQSTLSSSSSYLRSSTTSTSTNTNNINDRSKMPLWIHDATKEINVLFFQYHQNERSLQHQVLQQQNHPNSQYIVHSELIHKSDYGEQYTFHLQDNYIMDVHVLNA